MIAIKKGESGLKSDNYDWGTKLALLVIFPIEWDSYLRS